MKICTLTYHEIVDNPKNSGFQRASALPYKHPVKEFKDHVKIFYENKIVTPKISKIDFNSNENYHIISFDDGGISNLDAADILEESGFIGHFLITTGFLNKTGFLTKNHILDLHKRGHVIGAHSNTHPDIFYRLPYDKMLNEWNISKSMLENILGEGVNCASIPGGEMNGATWKSSADSGLDFLFCSEPFLVPQKRQNWLIGRVCPKQGTDYQKIANFINYKGFKTEMGIRNFKNIVKRVYYPLNEILKK